MNFKGKRVAVLGLGIEGFSTLRFLQKQGASVAVFDQKETKLETAVESYFGEGYLNHLKNFDYIFRSPGVRPDLEEIQAAQKSGALVISQVGVFFNECKAPIIGVTGTKGKGTTSTLIFEIIKEAGKKVFLAGNIGKPVLDVLEKVTDDSLVVLELSSFQLIDLKQSPHIAVLLMVTSEHLDWHKSRQEYIEAKANLVRYQEENDFVVFNHDYQLSITLAKLSKGEEVSFSTKTVLAKGAFIKQNCLFWQKEEGEKILELERIKIPGEHNLQNILAAVSVAKILGIENKLISKAVSQFNGLEHRLEFVSEIDGKRFYNDSASTNPETAIAAINAFREPKIMILGGSSKKSDFSLLGKAISEKNVKAVILIGQESPRIKEAILNYHFSGKIVEGLTSMEEVVETAIRLGQSGDVVILSPACASFGMFKNYQERGEKFKKAILSFKSQSSKL